MKVYVIETYFGIERIFSTRELAESYISVCYPVHHKPPKVTIGEYEVDA